MIARDAFGWLDAGLGSVGRRTTRLGARSWQLGRGAARGPRILAAVAGEWLTLTARRMRAPRDCAAGADAVALIEANAALPHGARFVLEELGPASVHVRADLALHPEARGDAPTLAAALETPLRDACDALAYGARTPLAQLRRSASAASSGAPIPASTRTHLTELRWPVHGSDGQRARVDLEAHTGAVRQAVIHESGGHLVMRWNLRADLPETLDPEPRQAVALLLLRTAGALPFLRPASRGSDFLGFEVVVPAPAAPASLDAALGSLSLAARFSGAEAEALAASPSLATAYLRTTLPAALARRAPTLAGRHGDSRRAVL